MKRRTILVIILAIILTFNATMLSGCGLITTLMVASILTTDDEPVESAEPVETATPIEAVEPETTVIEIEQRIPEFTPLEIIAGDVTFKIEGIDESSTVNNILGGLAFKCYAENNTNEEIGVEIESVVVNGYTMDYSGFYNRISPNSKLNDTWHIYYNSLDENNIENVDNIRFTISIFTVDGYLRTSYLVKNETYTLETNIARI